MPRRRPPFLAAAILAVLPLAAAWAQTAAPEVIAEIRIHGNYRTPDDEVLRIAGITVGSPLGANAVEAAADRLRRSGRFESVDLRKRYRSSTTPRRSPSSSPSPSGPASKRAASCRPHETAGPTRSWRRHRSSTSTATASLPAGG